MIVLIDRINKIVSYVLLALLWAPHGARECVLACTGPFFISPMIVTFLMPNWTMDMSLHGWLLQLLFAPPLLGALYLLFRFEKKRKLQFLQIYAVRWAILWFVILAYYNLIFWSSLREYLLPFFIFTSA
jgi:hypothetical protein